MKHSKDWLLLSFVFYRSICSFW